MKKELEWMRVADRPHIVVPFHRGLHRTDNKWQKCTQLGEPLEQPRIPLPEPQTQVAESDQPKKTKRSQKKMVPKVLVSNTKPELDDLVAGLEDL